MNQVDSSCVKWKPYIREELSQEIVPSFLEALKYNHDHILLDRDISPNTRNIFLKNFKEIEFDFKKSLHFNEMHNFRSFVSEILDEVYTHLETAEKNLHCEELIKRKDHLYPYDILLLLGNSEIPEKKLKTAGVATTLFYMLSHFTDDYIDDHDKIYLEFIKPCHDEREVMKKVFDIFTRAFKEFAEENFSKKSAVLLQGVYISKYFDMILKLEEMVENYRTIRNSCNELLFTLEMKACGLSGIMYSFLSDIIFETVDVCRSVEDYNELFETTKHLGCLCQLTDDLRDFEKDLQRNEMNIVHFMMRDFLKDDKEDSLKVIFNKFFEKELNEILRGTKNLNIPINKEWIIFISSYPFFKNNL
ncbi:MAG: class 1 isoprenoid biosynthesis enzyme [Theionarchaea archaeon]|nr:MAG: hypothetical protein AYK19_04345 [Theionarchaea archaeon DG-70-1]MBU7029301.1 class 1 isoprenoid biosynthesis enzyme [Theionarchaea archaeon]